MDLWYGIACKLCRSADIDLHLVYNKENIKSRLYMGLLMLSITIQLHMLRIVIGEPITPRWGVLLAQLFNPLHTYRVIVHIQLDELQKGIIHILLAAIIMLLE